MAELFIVSKPIADPILYSAFFELFKNIIWPLFSQKWNVAVLDKLK